MELLRNSYSSGMFSLYASKLNSMALSLESLLKKTLTKKTTPIRRHIQQRATYNVIPPQDSTASNGTTSNVTVNLSLPNVLTRHSLTDNNTTPNNNITTNSNYTSSHITCHESMSNTLGPTRKRSRRKRKPAKLPLDQSSIINLSNSLLSPVEISVLARGLTFCPTPRHIDQLARSMRSKRSCSTEELRNEFRKLAARKFGQEAERTLARRPPIFEKPVRPRTGVSDWCDTVTMIDRRQIFEQNVFC